MAEVLDYSAGWPVPAAIKAAQYVGVVRYIGTPGSEKNLDPAEAAALTAAGIPIALVYESTAGWMLGGYDAGLAAARAALADAKRCGVGVRCVYFAADFDVTSDPQMIAAEKCLDGAAAALDRPRVGVYGEADVIDACLGAKHATYGWQTRAWSGGRLSSRAHLLQLGGYVYPGGVQCDRSTVIKADWGQWPATAGATDEEDDVPAEDVWKQQIPVPAVNRDLFVHGSYSAADLLMGQAVRAARLERTEAVQNQRIAAMQGTVTALSGVLADVLASVRRNDVPTLTAEQITAAANAGATAALQGVLHVQVTVDQPDTAPNPDPTEGENA